MLRAIILGAALLATGNSPAFAKPLKVAVPILSGHFDESLKGRSAAALDAIFDICGIKAEFVGHKWGQHWLAYDEDKSFDAVAIAWEDAGVSGYFSADFIHQKNGVAYLASRGFEIKTTADLKGLRVMGFGGATRMFPELASVLPDLASYWEAPSGFATTQALVNGDVDAFVTDGLIFAIDYMIRIQDTGATYGDSNWPAMKFSGLFRENGDKVAFRTSERRDQFNSCLATAQESGAIASATKPYVDPYRNIVGDQIPEQ